MTEPVRYEISIEAVAEYVPAQSSPHDSRYAFSYRITISNHGSVPAKLLSRHWLITDGSGDVEEVHGDGVVGEQPVIPPGGQHHYSSGAFLSTPVGTMHGSYRMRASDGHHFEAPIAPFRLAVPHRLH